MFFAIQDQTGYGRLHVLLLKMQCCPGYLTKFTGITNDLTGVDRSVGTSVVHQETGSEMLQDCNSLFCQTVQVDDESSAILALVGSKYQYAGACCM